MGCRVLYWDLRVSGLRLLGFGCFSSWLGFWLVGVWCRGLGFSRLRVWGLHFSGGPGSFGPEVRIMYTLNLKP